MSYTLSFGCLVVILLITLFIIRLISDTNRRLTIFFGSLHSGDVTTHYPDEADDPLLRNLYGEMNRITRLFGNNRTEVEERRLYYESILRVLTHEIRNSITPIASLSADLLTHLPDPDRKTVCVQQLFTKLNRLLCAEPDSCRVQYLLTHDSCLQADPNLLVLALINLIRNALQAIADQPDGIVKVEMSGTASHPCITVTDNGPGIPPERLSAIFTPFFTTKTGGSGIGLSISERIMQLHGGRIRVSSTPNVQTTFVLEFSSAQANLLPAGSHC